MSVEFFRNLYRHALARTRNQTIARHDKAVRAGSMSKRKFSTEQAREAQRRGVESKRSTYTKFDWQAQILPAIRASAKLRRGKPAGKSAASHAAKAQWASLTDEEKAARMTRVRVAKYGGAPWPFPFAPRSLKSQEEKREAARAGLVKARAAKVWQRRKRRA